MITDLNEKCIFRREVGDSASLIRDFSALVPEGQYIQVIIDNYGLENEILREINRVDIIPYQQCPTFELEPQIDFRGDDWHFPLTVHYYPVCEAKAPAFMPGLSPRKQGKKDE